MIRSVFSLLTLPLMAGLALADTFTVGPGGAHATLQAAIDAAIGAGGDNEILIRQGVYFQSGEIEGDLAGSLVISGGWNANFSLQTMDGTLTVFTGNGVSQLIEANLSGGSLRLEYLTFQSGFSEERGGGLKLLASEETVVSLVGCVFSGNRAGLADGSSLLASASALDAVLSDQAELTLEDCIFKANETRAFVGGTGAVQVLMRNSGANRLHISDCEFEDNFVRTRQSTAKGGALTIAANGSTEVYIEKSLFLTNSCESSVGVAEAGGLLLEIWEDARFQIHDSLFSGNRISSQGEVHGGALRINAADQVIGLFDGNRIENNRATGTGPATGYGASYSVRGEAILEANQNQWLENSGPPGGGDAQVEILTRTSFLLRDSLVAHGCGGISGFGSALQLTNLTIAHNQGTGIQLLAPNLDNSIVFGNETDLLDPGAINGDNNLIGNDPFLADPGNGDFRPLPGSPAIDAGNNDPPGGLGLMDVDGDDRLFGPRVDVGSYELNRAENVQYLTQIGNGQSGNLTLSTGIKVASFGSEQREAFTIDFFDSSGAPLFPFTNSPTFLQGLTTSSLSVLLTPGETWTMETSGEGDVQAGYARIRGGEHIGVTGVFTRRHTSTGTILYQAGVPAALATRAATLFVDSTGNLETGLAIVNAAGGTAPAPATAAQPGEILLSLYDQEFSPVAQRSLELAPGRHLAAFVSQLFEETEQAEEMRGILTVESSDPVALTTLRQSDRPGVEFPDEIPTLAAFPVLGGLLENGAAPSGGFDTVEFFLAQIGNGQAGPTQLQTSVNVVNLAAAQIPVRLDFFASSGSPLEVTVEGIGTDSSFDFQLESGESRVLKTDGLGALQAGYAKVTSFQGVGRSAVFSQTHLPTGLLETESGVPASPLLQNLSLLVDTTADLNTAIALVKPGLTPAGEDTDLELTLFDMQGQEIASRALGLEAGTHTAQFVTELFADVEGIDEMRGLLGISSAVPIVAVTLLQNDDPEINFPDDVATLTAFPVFPGTP